MLQRGRKSSKQLETIEKAAVSVVERPDPPLELTPEESDIWVATIESLPADWFQPSTYPLLIQYCRHVVGARRIAQLIDQEMSREEIDVVSMRRLHCMQVKESQAIKTMASSMRISQQASYNFGAADTAKRKHVATTTARPWE